MKRLIFLIMAMAVSVALYADDAAQRALRRHIAEGNKAYSEKRYSDAEAAYKKALQADPASMAATYNLASSLIRQATAGEAGKKLNAEAAKLLNEVITTASDNRLASYAAYNLGNMAFNSQQWDQSIQYYKEALRRNPDDDNARDNLRLAQLKKSQSQNQDKDKNQDKDNKEQEKEKEQQKQDQQNQQQPPQNNDQKQQPQQPQGGISPENAEKILKAMENEEAATRARVQEAEKRKGAAGRRVVTKPW